MSNHQCTHNKSCRDHYPFADDSVCHAPGWTSTEWRRRALVTGKLIGKKSYRMVVRPNITVDLTIFGELMEQVKDDKEGGAEQAKGQRSDRNRGNSENFDRSNDHCFFDLGTI